MTDHTDDTTESNTTTPDRRGIGDPLPVPDDADPEAMASMTRGPEHDSPEGFHHPLDHYLMVRRDDLIAEAAGRRASPEGSVPTPLKKALVARGAWTAIYPDTEAPFGE